MEKEMKKLLLVAVSVGVFLLVTITVALIVLTPKPQTQEAGFSSSVPFTQIKPAVNNGTTTAVAPEFDIPVAALNENNERTEAVIASDRNNGDRLTIQVPVPSSAAIPEATETPAAVVKTPAVKPSSSSNETRTAVSQNTSSSAVKQTTAASKTAVKAINDFWVQTGAYPSMVGAEDIREALANNGLTGIVSIFDNQERDGRTWYRVRLGPYTSEREANHWLAIVKSINGFDKSEVRKSVRQQ